MVVVVVRIEVLYGDKRREAKEGGGGDGHHSVCVTHPSGTSLSSVYAI